MGSERVTAVVVSYNTRDCLRSTLGELRGQVDVLLECIVVDNDSEDGSAEMVEREFPDVELIRSPQNLGLAGGANAGMLRSHGDFVCAMNADLELESNALRVLAEYLVQNPRVGACSPQLLNSDGTLQPSGRRFPAVTDIVSEAYHLSWLLPRDHLLDRDFSISCRVDTVPGACLMVRRSILDLTGGYDARNFFVNWEDIDWCRRIVTAGFEVHFVGAAVGTHHLGASTAVNPIDANVSGRTGAVRYVRKHNGLLPALALVIFLIPRDLGAVVRYALLATSDARAMPRLMTAVQIAGASWTGEALKLR